MRKSNCRNLLAFLLLSACLSLQACNAHAQHLQTRTLTSRKQQQLNQIQSINNEEEEVTTTTTGWERVGQELIGEAASDLSGWAVAMSRDGTRIAASATKNDSGGTESGHVRIFDFNSNNKRWYRVGNEIVGPAGSQIGVAMALSGDGNTVAMASNAVSPYTGYVRVYRLNTNNNQWQKLGDDLVGTTARDRFGASISLNHNGNRLAIGAPYHNGNDQIRGQVKVYELSSGNTWTRLGSAINGEDEGDKAHVVSLNKEGTVLAVGSPTNNGVGRNSGSVRIFQKTSSTSDWTQLGPKINGAAVNDQSGTAVDLSENGMTVVIGSPYHSRTAGQTYKSGQVRVFTYDVADNTWTQVGSSITAETIDEWLGSSVAISDNGMIVATGAPKRNSKGQVRIFQYAQNTWNLGGIIDGDYNQGEFGASIALSGDGTDIVVGGYSSAANGEDSGTTLAYKFTNNAAPGWNIELNNLATSFGGVDDDEPELTFTYDGLRPDTNDDATYKLTMLTSSCVLGQSNDDAIAPVAATGTVPKTETFSLTPKLDVDTSEITASTYYFSNQDGSGQISFCLKVEILVGNEVVTFESADVSLDIDQTKGFEVTNFQTNRKPSIVRVSQEAQFNYTLNSYFCDENAVDIGQDTREVYPGEEVTICLEAPEGEGAEVVDVQSVSFENAFAPLLGVVLIDSEGNPRQSTTVKDCEDGTCRVSAVTVPQLYEYMDNNGNVVDVSQGVYITGTVVYEFARRRLQGKARNLQSPDNVKSKFTMKMQLAEPPDRSSAAPPSKVVPNTWLLVVASIVLTKWMVH